jgi:peptidoglycan/LPS O-acetylase OafA/YrhL
MLASRHLLAPALGGNDLQKVCAAVLVASIYHGNGGALGRILGRPPCAFLGRISFSFYLYCMPVMEAVGRPLLRHFNAAQHPLEFGLLASIAIVGCTVPIALLSERFIERPCIELGSRLSRHFVPRPAAAAGQQGSQKVGLSLLR